MSSWLKKIKAYSDYAVIGFLLIISNLHLAGFGSIYSVIFNSSAIASGEFFRLITFSFAHVSWYHLLLDASAFLFLYSALKAGVMGQKILHVVMSIGMSLVFSMLLAPQIKEVGLCGLSGAAHGLFLILSLEMMKSEKDRIVGIICAVSVLLKCCVELTTGGAVFHFIHGDMIGMPVLVSHAGGLVGGLISYLLVNGRGCRKITVAVISLFFLLFTGGTERLYAVEGKRTALVIGNSQYGKASLKNPVNDAQDMATALEDSGFEVMLKTNTNRRTMEDSIRGFGKKLRDGGTGLFFYAGHAVQVKGANYLIPVGSRIQDEADIVYEAVDAGRILSAMHLAGNALNIVILDACRDNPFEAGSRSGASVYRGLARMVAPKGTLIAYSTSPGRVAADGDGRNSPYTGLLLNYMKQRNTPIETVFKNVRRSIDKETDGRQIPWEVTSLTGDFYFNWNDQRRANAFTKLGASFPDTPAGLPVSGPKGADVSFRGDVPSSSAKSHLKIHVSNNTGYVIPNFTVRGGGLNVSQKIDAESEVTTHSVCSGYIESGRYHFVAEAQYGFTEDDIAAGVPAIPVASRTFSESITCFVSPGERKELWMTIGFKNSGFWETRKKEALVIDISESQPVQIVERSY